jgi:hypothetical protein
MEMPIVDRGIVDRAIRLAQTHEGVWERADDMRRRDDVGMVGAGMLVRGHRDEEARTDELLVRHTRADERDRLDEALANRHCLLHYANMGATYRWNSSASSAPLTAVR